MLEQSANAPSDAIRPRRRRASCSSLSTKGSILDGSVGEVGIQTAEANRSARASTSPPQRVPCPRYPQYVWCSSRGKGWCSGGGTKTPRGRGCVPNCGRPSSAATPTSVASVALNQTGPIVYPWDSPPPPGRCHSAEADRSFTLLHLCKRGRLEGLLWQPLSLRCSSGSLNISLRLSVYSQPPVVAKLPP